MCSWVLFLFYYSTPTWNKVKCKFIKVSISYKNSFGYLIAFDLCYTCCSCTSIPKKNYYTTLSPNGYVSKVGRVLKSTFIKSKKYLNENIEQKKN